MPQLKNKLPKYRKHRASGQAIVTLDGRDFYLGPHGTDVSHAEYDRLVGEWLANNRHLPVAEDQRPSLKVNKLILDYWLHVTVEHQDNDGRLTAHAKKIKGALRTLRRLYGHTPAADFGPLALKAVRQAYNGPMPLGASQQRMNQ